MMLFYVAGIVAGVYIALYVLPLVRSAFETYVHQLVREATR